MRVARGGESFEETPASVGNGNTGNGAGGGNKAVAAAKTEEAASEVG